MGGAICLLGTHRYAACIATVLMCMIHAVLNVAYNSLDMLGIIAFCVVAISLLFHFDYLISFFPLMR